MVTAKLEQVVAIYVKELECFRRMLAFAGEQVKCVSVSNYTVLGEILERRRGLAEEISALSAQAQATAQGIATDLELPELNLSSLRQQLPEAAVAPLEQVLAQLREVAEEIQQIDRRCEVEVRQAMQGLRGEMSDVQRGQTAMRAYKNAPQPNDARFIDKQK